MGVVDRGDKLWEHGTGFDLKAQYQKWHQKSLLGNFEVYVFELIYCLEYVDTDE